MTEFSGYFVSGLLAGTGAVIGIGIAGMAMLGILVKRSTPEGGGGESKGFPQLMLVGLSFAPFSQFLYGWILHIMSGNVEWTNFYAPLLFQSGFGLVALATAWLQGYLVAKAFDMVERTGNKTYGFIGIGGIEGICIMIMVITAVNFP